MKNTILKLILIFITASVLASYKVQEKHCLKLIADHVRSNDGVINFPSTLGEDCNTETKIQLVLFLVCITQRFVDLKETKRNLYFDTIIPYSIF